MLETEKNVLVSFGDYSRIVALPDGPNKKDALKESVKSIIFYGCSARSRFLFASAKWRLGGVVCRLAGGSQINDKSY